MPSYIELQKNGAIPSSSPVGTVILSVNQGQLTLTDNNVNPNQPAYTTVVRSLYPSASLAETWGTYTVNYLKQKSGYSPSEILYALGICSDDVDAFTSTGNLGQYPLSMQSLLGPFYCGGLAGYPFVGNVGFGAFASHITDTGSLFISCTPHIGITVTGSAGYQFRKGQAAISTNCGAVHGAVNWARTANTPPTFSVSAPAAVSASVFGAENYELFRLAQIIYPYKAALTGSQSQDVMFGTRLIRDAGWQYIYNNSGSFAGALGARKMYAIGGTFINPDYGYEGYVDINQFQEYNPVTNTWNDLTQDYKDGLFAQG
jgi:Limiting CO2-inducible proteins B/C beta carbonyic anhydrases